MNAITQQIYHQT